MSFSFLLMMLFLLLKFILLPELFFYVFKGEGNFFEPKLSIAFPSGDSLLFSLIKLEELFIEAKNC